MSCSCGPKQSAEEKSSKELEAQLRDERFQDLFKFKVLLLGAGETGKSTIVKQIKLAHNKIPTDKENEAIADSLHQNVIDCMKTLIYACTNFEEQEKKKLEESKSDARNPYIMDPETKRTAVRVQSWDENGGQGKRIDGEFADEIVKLWESEAIKKTYKRNDEFWLLDSCKYYFTHVERFAFSAFKPTAEDSVMARIRTTGIVVSAIEEKNPPLEIEQYGTFPGLNVPDMIRYQVVDVGGQKNERKKWMHCFDDVKCVLFLISLAEYNQKMFEIPGGNRMDDSLQLLGDISKKKEFEKTPLFVFMNKKDVFKEMLVNFPLSNKFPEYKDGANDIKGIDFLKQKYRAALPIARQSAINFFPITGVVKKDVADAFSQVKEQLRAGNKKIQEEMKKIKAEKDAEEAAQRSCVIS